MSDAEPLAVFHRASREVSGVGCVLDPWLVNRSWPCPEPPGIGLEPLDCLVNKFLELPVRFRGAVPLVPHLDLDDVRTDPWIQAARSVCANGLLIDLLAAFDRSGKACAALCGAKPYGDAPDCPALADDMGMAMLGCYGDYDTADPGCIIPTPGSAVPGAAGLGAPANRLKPTCPVGASSSGSSCVETCATMTVTLAYMGPCLYEVKQSVCVCGDVTTVTMADPVEAGCDCCPPESSSSSSESSASSESSSSAGSSSASSSVPSSSSVSSSVSSSESSSESSSSPCGTQCYSPHEKPATAYGMGWGDDRASALADAIAGLDAAKLDSSYDPRCICGLDTAPFKSDPLNVGGSWGEVVENCAEEWEGYWNCSATQVFTAICGKNQFGCCDGEATCSVGVNFQYLLPGESGCDPAGGHPGNDLLCAMYMYNYTGLVDEACAAKCVADGKGLTGRWNTCPFNWSVEGCTTYGYGEPVCCCGGS